MPGDMYLKDKGNIKSWGFTLTSVDWRIADRNEKIRHTEKLVSGEEEIVLHSSGEEGILLIKALCGLTSVVTNVNLPNSALQLENIPKETVVETNALFSKDSVKPINAGRMPDKIYTLTLPHIENQTIVLEAALNFDVNKLYSAFEREPLVHGRCTGEQIRLLVDDMLKNTMPC
jgi:alpha-galactosidase